jgi:hypothetical protein
MRSNTIQLLSNFKRYLTRTIGTLFLMFALWQGISLNIDTANAESSIEVAVPAGIGNNKANVVKQLEEKEKVEVERVQAAMKDGEQSVSASLDKAKTAMEGGANKAEKLLGKSRK